MSSQRCQATTLSGNQCKRNAVKNQFCTQHNNLKLKSNSTIVHIQHNNLKLKSNSTIVHYQRACQFKHKSMTEKQPCQCNFKNTVGNFVCKQDKIDGSEFCSEHNDKFISFLKEVETLRTNLLNHFNIGDLAHEIMCFHDFFVQLLKIKHMFVQFSRNEQAHELVVEYEWTFVRAKNYSYNFSVCMAFNQMMEIRSDVSNFFVEKQIEIAKKHSKTNEIKLNMLSEIYLRDPQPQSKQLQPVFNKDINNKIMSFLI